MTLPRQRRSSGKFQAARGNMVSIWLTLGAVYSRPPTLVRHLWLILCLLAAGSGFASLAEASDYRSYATALVRSLPEGAQIRPDLESYLDKLASTYRLANGRKSVAATELMRIAARAQAADMMLSGVSGHRSRNGESFHRRFGSFVADIDLYRARGENAASERHKGPVDKAKAKRLFELWLGSRGHRQNLMKRDYEFVSTGAVQRGDELWAVQIFWSRPVEAQSNGGLFFQ